MAEKLEIYDLNGDLIGVEDRDKFYSEIREEFSKKGIISRQVKRILLFLMNSKGRIIIQRRNFSKEENPGLYDKTVGGHVEEGDTYEVTLIKECAEELGFPVSILDESHYDKALKKTNLRIVGIFKELDYETNFLSTRISRDGKKFAQPYMQKVFMGYFNGAIEFIDGESSGIQLYSVTELETAINENPEDFTGDLKVLFKKYKKFLKPIN